MEDPRNAEDQPLTLEDIQAFREKMGAIGTVYVQDAEKVVGAYVHSGVSLTPAHSDKRVSAKHAVIFDNRSSLARVCDRYHNFEVRFDPGCEVILLDLANHHSIPPTEVTRAMISVSAHKAFGDLITLTISGLALPDDPHYDVRKRFVDLFVRSFGVPKKLLEAWLSYLDLLKFGKEV